ncbi:hypothetical protein EI42_02164 [Thermosporothrix hazakensis]|jgi:hypothetical protein|uniref:Uncharacterized protein n=2 Tax=Thermosporothrix TaxID=768650 RepID=A0A326U969_THEHA|nr:hypothetical protein [Thermosporothrix hazakensis]PZW31067.1 hypothetical protein EI42_02164 [Thermosporothrix hazakensis]BBH86716.1 hypothetical protein KTC_14670 [Thermosporothrix sp. COM3]GCE51019.1 hypothetical protein KTH_58880 [Thermosporothrix hazakensis]
MLSEAVVSLPPTRHYTLDMLLTGERAWFVFWHAGSEREHEGLPVLLSRFQSKTSAETPDILCTTM